MLLAAFFYGLFLTQMVGGILAPIVGGARLVGLAMLITSVLTLFSPAIAHCGFIPFLICRAVSGLFQVYNFFLLVEEDD